MLNAIKDNLFNNSLQLGPISKKENEVSSLGCESDTCNLNCFLNRRIRMVNTNSIKVSPQRILKYVRDL